MFMINTKTNKKQIELNCLISHPSRPVLQLNISFVVTKKGEGAGKTGYLLTIGNFKRINSEV